MSFAKLFGTDDQQVLVMIDSGDNGPEVQYHFQPKDLGVCKIAVNFPDTDEGWDKAERAFEATTEEAARKIVGKALASIDKCREA